MVSSDEDGEIIPEWVTNYWFFDQSNVATSFTCLPLRWSGGEVPDELQGQIFFRGTGDDGLQEICKQVIAWRVELSYVLPEISVLSKNGKWIQLLNPRKSFEKLIRSELITIHCLHYLKKNREASRDQVWNYLKKAFGPYELQPSTNDLGACISLIKEAIRTDKDLANCKYLLSFMDEDITKAKASYKDVLLTKMSKFIADDMDDFEGLAEEEPSFHTICAICDNGGEIVPCEGICMRSFHATKTAGGDFCESLGFINDAQIEAIPVFKCNNCKYKKHQCFACGRLGSSDVFFGAEVFPCFSGTCGHFYHPKCVAELLHPFDKVQAKEAEKKIISGEPFTCPVHKCVVCCQIEDKTVHDLQLAVCRRCPKSYHRKCLPRDITFWSDGESPIRAWNHLLSNRILIYCMNHSIDLTLGTPGRDHIIFPYVDVAKKKRSTPNRLKLPKRSVTSGSCSIERTTAEIPKSFERYFNMSYVAEPRKPWSGHLSLLQKRSTTDSRSSKKVSAVTQFISSTDVKSRSFNWHNNSSLSLTGKRKNSDADALVDHFYSKNDMENRILSLIRDTSASFDEAYEREQIAKANHAMLDRNITLGKVEHYVKAIRTAVEKMEKGSTIEEAKEVCEPGILKQLFIWRKKLTVQMAPFLYGALYTSFGRHFTKSKKLEEIVDRLQWYVQHGDTIVDFCCGANEFSFLLKEKLEKVGKNCFFKNYDLFSPQNNFNFEKRDWMSVDVKELPSGDKLIMALNPPFGVKASLANKFITKAGEFKPKLLILIVPDETERLDTGDAPYDLIWRDKKLLSGKSYLPGSTDANNQLLDDWNQQPPSLYLWSRPDWTPWHKCLAETNGHVANDLHRMMIDINAPPSSSDLNQQPGQCYYDPFTDCWSAT